jgi:hypothetical protein
VACADHLAVFTFNAKQGHGPAVLRVVVIDRLFSRAVDRIRTLNFCELAFERFRDSGVKLASPLAQLHRGRPLVGAAEDFSAFASEVLGMFIVLGCTSADP